MKTPKGQNVMNLLAQLMERRPFRWLVYAWHADDVT
jgi:hypothetical protein